MRFLRIVMGLRLSARLSSLCCALAVACLAWCGSSQPASASQATTTKLALTSGGNAVSSVAGGTVVTLTATVEAGGTALKLGQVNFCDTIAASCTDIHLLGTAQLTSDGAAALRFRPGPGSHSYKAVFLGTLDGAPSASAAVGLTVGPRPPGLQTTYTVAAVTGPNATNAYALSASVGTKGTIPPSGTISFSGVLNTTTAYSVPGTGTLGTISGGSGFLNVPLQEPSQGLADAPPLIAIGDFNGDGIPDIVSAPFGGIAVSLGKGDGTFAAPLIPDVDSADGINAFGVGDFNGDGNTDLLVDDEDTGKLTVLLGNGDGTFTVGQSLAFSSITIAVADFNGDGKADAAVAGNNGTTILLGNGDGTFAAAPNVLEIVPYQLVAADFNSDGKIDLAVVGPATNTATIELGNGDGTFSAAPNPPQMITSRLVAADFNGDGKLDLAAIGDTPGNTLAVLLGNGDGTFVAPSTLPTDANFNALGLAVGDFNGDGKPDIAETVSSTTPGGPNDVSIFPGNGDGTFAARFEVPPSEDVLAEGLASLAAVDFTGNGSSDLSVFGSVFLGSLTISTATLDANLPAGGNVIQADYAGDANNAPSHSTNKPQIFVLPQPFSLTSNPVTVTSGASASGSFAVTSTSFTGTLNLSCLIAAPQGDANPPACSVPSAVDFSSAPGTVNQTYTVTTLATTAAGQYSITIKATDTAGGTTAVTSAEVTVRAQNNYVLSNTGATIASPGASATSTITVTGDYTGQIALTCAVTGGPSGAVNPPACTIPSPISLAGSPVTTTLTLTTQAATTPGAYSVTVTGVSAGSLSATTSFTVNVPVNVPAVPMGFTLSSTAVTIASPGTNATSTITITPSGGFTGSVALSCAVTGGPAGGADAPTCSVASPPVITGATAVTATLTVSTTPASNAQKGDSVARNQHPPFVVAISGCVIGMASLLMFGLRRPMTYFGLLFVATLIGAATGCGNGTMSAVPPPNPGTPPTNPGNPGTPPANPGNPGTAPGAYIVTVTASSGSIMAATAVSVTLN
jgi:trimeric autotransporter adhesin